MSGFKRNENLKSKEDQYRAFIGHPELDAILQNNLIKGQIIVLEQDSPSTIYLQIQRYFVGAAYHSQQSTIIYDENAQKWTKMVPQIAQFQQQQTQKQQNQHQIAWRYSDMNMQFKLTNINKEIPELDLSKSQGQLEERLLRLNELQKLNTYKDLIKSIIDQYQTVLKSSSDSSCKKLLISNLFHPMISLDLKNLVKFLHSLKIFCRSSHMLVLISIPNGYIQKELFQKYCDIYLSVSQIFQNEQFSEFHGILKIEKIGSFGQFKQINIQTDKWGIKIMGKGRSLEIESLFETAVKEDETKEQQQICSSKFSGNENLNF